MLQNKFLFNKSSVSLEIIGLPDYSTNENNDHISIISQWKLMIIDLPLIEGNLDHLRSVMEAFYSYSAFLLNDEYAFYESDLIDIKSENHYTHKILLKSSKPDVKPLNIKIGNSILVDIINCFDQLGSSIKVKNIYTKNSQKLNTKNYLNLFDKNKISNFILPPLLSLCSVFFVSTAFIYFYNNSSNNRNSNSSLLDTNNKFISIKSINAIL